MANAINTQMVDSDLLSPLAQQRLRARIADAPGGNATVVQEIQAQLAELDSTDMSSDATAQHTRLADRAFYVAQLEYLDRLERAANLTAQSNHPGLLARLRSMFRRTRTAK